MTVDTELADAVDERLAARIADARQRREQQAADRRRRARRRKAGLAARHREKLARLTEGDQQ